MLESKEKQIAEMAKIAKAKLGCVCRYDCGNCGGCYSYDHAEALYNAGYRKYRRGRWIQTPPSYCSCSECQTEGSPRWKCCPVCMAVMEVDV